MFRLVKVLNGNNQHETLRIPLGEDVDVTRGCALTSSNGKLTFPTATVFPDYIALADSTEARGGKLDVIMVTEDMVFLAETVNSTAPYVGMRVGITTKNSKMDAVSYNSNGKGTVIDVGEKGFVYVKFNK